MRILCGTILAAGVAFAAFGDSLGNVGDVRLKGRLGERLNAMIERHVAARDVDYITAPFMEKTETKGWWQTEFWGKWMHASVPYLRYVTDGKCKVESVKCKVAEELCSKIERGIDRILASQEANGYIGNYPDEFRCGEGWDVWGMKFDMPVVAHTLDHHVAFTRGPVLLARDSRFADGDLTEPFRRGIKDGQAMPTFTAVRTPSDDIWMAFSATLPIGSHTENPEAALQTTVYFCDYASAGDTWTRDNFYRTWFPVEYTP